MNTITRGALFGAACALCAIVAAGSAAAQTYPPGTNCQSLLPGLRASCMNQVRQMNSGMSTNSTIVPNSAGANTIPAPGSVNSGTTVTPNGNLGPNAVVPNGTVNPNQVTPNSTVNPNAVQMPGAATNPVIVPAPAGTTGTGTSGTGMGGTGTTGTSGN
jgi:hypothetical protein